MPAKLVIYGLFDPRNGELRYVGRSTMGLSRRVSCHLTPASLRQREHRAHWLRSLVEKGLRPEAIVLEEVDSTEALSEAEVHWIASMRAIGCRLTNVKPGGSAEGHPSRHKGEPRPLSVRQAQSAAQRRNWADPAFAAKMSRLKGGRPFVDQHGNRFDTIQGAARHLGLSAPHIHAVLHGHRKTCGGRIFTYT